ncbi:MAG: SRPBCC domain-containing protein [Chloroflexi bacterium]|nr:SRPBCC domain-containing protein [Chloroflexota bacterium]
MDEAVFKALADANRRTLLDALFAKDGQSLGELCEHIQMTRFGVMKHLQVLEEAGLVVTQKVGREKRHYLNAVPIQMVYDRWVNKYMQPWANALTRLKSIIEEPHMTNKHILQIFIQTTPQQLWQALTESDFTERYYFGSRVQSDWQQGSPYHYPNPAGGHFVEGIILEVDPPRRLVMSFRPVWQYTANEEAPTSQVTWEIEPAGTACKLTLIHDGIDLTHPLTQDILTGWARITSGLKTLLETGKPLTLDL